MTEFGELLQLLRTVAAGVGKAVDLLETKFSGKENVSGGNTEISRENKAGQVCGSLHAAAAGKSPEIVRKFLAAGASPLAVDSQGRTPLHYAARGGSTEICEILVRANPACLKIRDQDGNLPADVAHAFRHFSLHRFLLGGRKFDSSSLPVSDSPRHLYFATPRSSLTPRSTLSLATPQSRSSLKNSINSLPPKLAKSPYAKALLSASSAEAARRRNRSKSAEPVARQSAKRTSFSPSPGTK